MNFSIHSRDGATVGLCAHFEEALVVMRRIDAAERIIRVSDGEVLATKTRFGKMKPLPAGVMS